MLSTSDFKRGVRIELDGDPFSVVDVSRSDPTARGGTTLIRVKLRNIRTGQLLDRTFKDGERLKAPDFEIRPAQYLYAEGGDTHYFMDTETFEQFPLPGEQIAGELAFLRPEDEVRALVFNGACIGIELPNTVTLEVAETQPGSRGDTVTAATKAATLETGLSVQVPLFVNTGDRIVVDTRECRYVRRA
jgi:elongation factor P